MNVIARPSAAPAASPAATPVYHRTQPRYPPHPRSPPPTSPNWSNSPRSPPGPSSFPKTIVIIPRTSCSRSNWAAKSACARCKALQNIAVINGRPAIWGDAMPGLCKASPVYQDLIETFDREDDPDFLTAVCVAKRHGSTPVTARFSVMDAKRAGLFTKGRTVANLPSKRMLQMRARSASLLRDCVPRRPEGVDQQSRRRSTCPRHPTGCRPRALRSTPHPSHRQPTPTLGPPEHIPTETPVTPPAAETPPDPPADATRDAVYRLQTKQGVTTFRTSDEWLACWAKIVRGCKAANALDKLRTARDTNAAHIAAIAAFRSRTGRHARRRTRPRAGPINLTSLTSLMTRHRRRPARHRPVPASPAALSGTITPDEAAAILADVEGRQALRRIQAAAARNLRDLPPIVEDHMQREPAGRAYARTRTAPGYFLGRTDLHGRPHLLVHSCTLAAGEKYGDCLSAPDGHYETWEAWPPWPTQAAASPAGTDHRSGRV